MTHAEHVQAARDRLNDALALHDQTRSALAEALVWLTIATREAARLDDPNGGAS